MDKKLEKICVLCGASDAAYGPTDLVAGRNGVEVVIRGIPAYRCDACDDVAIPGPLAVSISDAIESIISTIEQHRRQVPATVERGEPSVPR